MAKVVNYSKDPGESIAVSACQDCYLLVVGSDVERDDYDEFVEAYTKGLDGCHPTPGHIAEYAHPGTACDEDEECARTDFSSSPCGICGSPLGGTRDDVTLWPPIGTAS